MKPQSVGLVLSGGGARCIAHAGVLKALDELNIKIERISATSGGAIVAALYAGGVQPSRIPALAAKSRIFDPRNLSLGLKGLMKTDAFSNLLIKNASAGTFESLEIPLVVNATAFYLSEIHYFDSGSLYAPIEASCALPLIFSPVIINNTTYVDGGLLNNFPVEPLEGKCSHIIGVHVNPVEVRTTPVPVTRFIERCFQMAISSSVAAKAKNVDTLIEPKELTKYSIFDIRKAEEIARVGYRAVMNIFGPKNSS